MGNKISSKRGIEPPKINLSILLQTMNIIQLKMGHPVIIPLDIIVNLKSRVSIDMLNYECFSNSELHNLGVQCNDIYNDANGTMASFIVPEYFDKRIRISQLKNGLTLLTKKDEQHILKYQKKLCNRIWLDLDEYYKMLSGLVTKKINRLLLDKRIDGKQKVKIISDYYETGESGYYLYQLGSLAIRYRMLQSMILDRLIQESKNTRVTFKEIKIKEIPTNDVKKGIKFVITVKIRIK